MNVKASSKNMILISVCAMFPFCDYSHWLRFLDAKVMICFHIGNI